MRNLYLIILVVISLLGLVYVQYNLLKVGVVLEKRKFDQKMDRVFWHAHNALNQRTDVRNQILDLWRHDTLSTTYPPKAYKKELLLQSMEGLVQEAFDSAQVQVDFTLGLLEAYSGDTLVKHQAFLDNSLAYEQYHQVLAGNIFQECYCKLYLHLNVENLYVFLLGQLAYLIIPSVLFILLLLAMFALVAFWNR